MTSRNTDYDRFVHAFTSPLTALQGAAGLLRRRVEPFADTLTNDLVASLERSIARLRRLSDLLTAHARIQGDDLVVRLPAQTFHDLAVAEGAARERSRQPENAAGLSPVTVSQGLPSAGSFDRVADEQRLLAGPGPSPERPAPRGQSAGDKPGALLLIASNLPALDPLMDAVTDKGLRAYRARSLVEGIDTARQIRPDLIVLDLEIDQRGHLAVQILREDPDTKMIPLLLLRGDDSASVPPLSHVMERTADLAVLLAAIDEIIVAGRAQGEHQPRIFIVDDEPEVSRLIALQLESEGYNITSATSGAEALRIAQRQPFDLIILDLLLPDLDGLAVLGGLRAQPQTALTPIILLSALDSPQKKARGLQLGADDYVTKPFSELELSARVHAAMRRSELEGGANPSTRLPGNVAIERAILRRINQQTPFAVCYSDLDNFKAYNDTYSFLKGDAIIQQTAHVLTSAVKEFGNPDDFVGHIGGDDFVIITTPDRVNAVCGGAIARFDEMSPLFYDREARARGYIEGIDRQGNPARFPLVSISIAVVTNQRRSFSHPGEVAQRSVQPKKRAKLMAGSVCVIDE